MKHQINLLSHGNSSDCVVLFFDINLYCLGHFNISVPTLKTSVLCFTVSGIKFL